jgi:hypothetical protein
MSSSIVRDWNNRALDAIRAKETPPPRAARILAMLHAAIHDAVNSVFPVYGWYGAKEEPARPANAEVAAALAAFTVLRGIFTGQDNREIVENWQAALDSYLASVPENSEKEKDAKQNGMSLGKTVGEKILELRRNDNSNGIVLYRAGDGVYQWRQTPPAASIPDQQPVLPHWPYVKPFALVRAGQFRSLVFGLPPIEGQQYRDEFNRTRKEGSIENADSQNSEIKDRVNIARFWADGAGTATPPGHWNRIAQTVAKNKGYSLAEEARLFALLNLAEADAGIACWDIKYLFNGWRPVTAINYAIQASRTNNYLGQSEQVWLPLLETPRFPGYISGHSTFSAAGATILSSFIGTDNFSFEDSIDPKAKFEGVPERCFTKFSQAAKEAGISRIYGGIHFDADNLDGQAIGKAVGEYVFNNFLRPLSSGANPVGGPTQDDPLPLPRF